ncbi:MAG TPA: NAD(P)H:quinone oxidoreductase [Stellaceae bacterium]|jgi:NAD(P)H dehydrogenase (quinone)|nr:NAD(P)H:quinone oxidoreductase [Stellaceae bacterium]
MAKVLVLYYGAYGHVETLAQAVVEGAKSVAGTEVTLKRVKELFTAEEAKARYQKTEFVAPEATPDELKDYDAVIFGTATRYGMMAASMKHFLDQTGALWFSGAMIGKIASFFTSANTQHGGQDAAILNFQTVVQHLGMIVVPIGFASPAVSNVDEISGGSPYGASIVAGTMQKPKAVSENEKEIGRYQGKFVAETADALVRGRALQKK